MIPPGAPILTAARMRAAEEVAFRREPQEQVMERAGARGCARGRAFRARRADPRPRRPRQQWRATPMSPRGC